MGLRELGQNVSRVMDIVKAGETLVVTEHGRAIARLVPYSGGEGLDALVAEGRVIAPSSDAHAALNLPPLPAGEVSLLDLLDELRADER